MRIARQQISKLFHKVLLLPQGILNSKKSHCRQLVSLVLSLQMVFAPALAFDQNSSASINQINANAKSHSNSISNKLTQSFVQKMIEVNPLWEDFLKSDFTSMDLPVSVQDPALDQDPYFLRSQIWENGTELTQKAFGRFRFAKDDTGVTLQAKNLPAQLHLNLPITPFQETDEFLFFSLDENSRLFENSTGLSRSEDKPGEGLFFVAKGTLAARAQKNEPVPVFFFPLPGNGWKGQIDSYEFHETDTLAVANQSGDSIAIELKDVEALRQAQEANLMMAMAWTLKMDGSVLQMNERKFVYPAAGTTAIFGLLFTGLNLNDPSSSLWQTSEQFSRGNAAQPVDAIRMKVMNAIFKLNPFSSSVAQAAEEQGFLDGLLSLPPDVQARVTYVGSILLFMLAVSVVLKYAHPGIRVKLKNIAANRKEPKSIVGKASREIKQIFDVFAHMTTTVFQFTSVNFANAVELFFDRFAPAAASAEHTTIRRFLNNTIYFSRRTVAHIPVNAKTFWLGAIVMGTADTVPVIYQYMVVVPWLCESISPYLNENWQNRIQDAFDPGNQEVRKVIVEDSVRNAIAYLMSGASHFSADSKGQVIEMAEREVDAALRARGLDPQSPDLATERQNLINNKLDVILKLRGLPGQEEFLFDANTVFDQIPRLLGHTSGTLKQDDTERLKSMYDFFVETLDLSIAQALKVSIAEKEQAKNDLEAANRNLHSASNGEQLSAQKIQPFINSKHEAERLSVDAKDNFKVVEMLRETREQLEALRFPLTRGLELGGRRKKTAASLSQKLLMLIGHKEEAFIRRVHEEWSKSYGENAIQIAIGYFMDSAAQKQSEVGARALQLPINYEQQLRDSFILGKRFALTNHAIDRALQAAEHLIAEVPSEQSTEVYEILKEVQIEIGLVRNMALHGLEGVRQARRVRRLITLLSYEGSIEWAVKYVPDLWKTRFSPQSAQAAALLFRQGLYSLLSKDGRGIFEPAAAAVRKYTAESQKEAIDQVVSSHKELSAVSRQEAESIARSVYQVELHLRTQLEISKRAREQALMEEAANYKLPKKDFFQRRQETRAARYADEQMGRWVNQQVMPNAEGLSGQVSIDHDQYRNQWKKFFLESMASQVGLQLESVEDYIDRYSEKTLHKYEEKAVQFADQEMEKIASRMDFEALDDRNVQKLTNEEYHARWDAFFNEFLNKTTPYQDKVQYSKMLSEVEEFAELTTKQQMENDLGLKFYLEKMSEPERLKIEASLYAHNFLQDYKNATTERESVRLYSPNQPGRFQRIRQTKWVRENTFLTRSIRAIESVVDDQALKPGLAAAFGRNVPFFEDMRVSHRRMFKTMLTALTVSYAWSYYFWQTHIPYGAWLLMIITSAATISAPSQWLARAFRMNNLKPIGGTLQKVAYGIPYSFVTFLGMIPTLLLMSDAAGLVNNYVVDPFFAVKEMIPREVLISTAVTMAALSSRRVRRKIGETAQKGAEAARAAKDYLKNRPALRCEAIFSKASY